MAYNPEEDIKVSDLPEKTTDVVNDDKLLVIDSEDANILKQVDASKVKWSWWWSWDMLKSVYDKNNDWVVDNAEALWWKPASEYAKSADVQPTLESGVNIKTINGNSILWPWNIEIQGGTWTVDTEMSDTSTNAVQNKVIKAYVDSQSGWDGTTKTFIVGDFPTIAEWQEILDYYKSGKTPIIQHFNASYYPYYYRNVDGERVLVFVSAEASPSSITNTHVKNRLVINFNEIGVVTDFLPQRSTVWFLDTNFNYSTPYTPLYDWSPATKKYVDDAVVGGGWWTVDTEMSDSSTNAVQNKVIKTYVDTNTWTLNQLQRCRCNWWDLEVDDSNWPSNIVHRLTTPPKLITVDYTFKVVNRPWTSTPSYEKVYYGKWYAYFTDWYGWKDLLTEEEFIEEVDFNVWCFFNWQWYKGKMIHIEDSKWWYSYNFTIDTTDLNLTPNSNQQTINLNEEITWSWSANNEYYDYYYYWFYTIFA